MWRIWAKHHYHTNHQMGTTPNRWFLAFWVVPFGLLELAQTRMQHYAKTLQISFNRSNFLKALRRVQRPQAVQTCSWECGSACLAGKTRGWKKTWSGDKIEYLPKPVCAATCCRKRCECGPATLILTHLRAIADTHLHNGSFPLQSSLLKAPLFCRPGCCLKRKWMHVDCKKKAV